MSHEQASLDPASLLDGLDIDIPRAEGGRNDQQRAEEPRFFGPYQIIQSVGKGGVAHVLRARHIHPRYADTTFAVKVLHRELSTDPQVVALFRHEAYVLALLKHPNIIQTFEAGSQDGELFIAMEYIDGRDLENMLARCKRAAMEVPLSIAMHIIGELLEALAYAHELTDPDGTRLHLVHRDVSPANVFISYNGRIKLGDFGVALISAGKGKKTQELVGKPGYFAPEQLAGDPVDQRADIFSLGVVMFELLTQSRLFDGDSTNDILKANKRARVPRPSSVNRAIPEALDAVIMRALERKPSDRFQSAAEMAYALQSLMPPSVGMPLAVAALMRKIFLPEHILELELREGLAGCAVARGSGQTITVCSGDPRAQAAFRDLLLSRGYHPEICPSPAALMTRVQGNTPPAVILADVSCADFSPITFLSAVAKCGDPVPVVAVSEALAPQWIHYADAIGAVDLLFQPFNVERVLTAIRAAITGDAQAAASDMTSTDRRFTTRPHLLVVSKDPILAVRLATGLTEQGFEVDVSPTTSEAFERMDTASYHGIFLDVFPPTPSDMSFAHELRERPAVGVVPIVYLVTPNGQETFTRAAIARTAICLRTSPPETLARAMSDLLADERFGRVFVRYEVSLPVEMRYGGRVCTFQATDLSRGGVMMRGDQIPPFGTDVSVAMKLPKGHVVEIAGRVQRVDLPKSDRAQGAGIGVEFLRFVGRSESLLIAFLRDLNAELSDKRSS